MVGSFATAEEFCEFTGFPVPSDFARLQALLQMSSATMRAYCDQTLSAVTGDVFTAYPTASTFLSLPERPVTAVSQVLVDGVATTDFYVVPRGIRAGTVASPGSAWTSGATVTYSHGYAETANEFSVFRAICIEAAAMAFTMNERSAQGGLLTEAVGFAPQIFLTEAHKQTLRPFMRGPVR
jgi:hypothetical protein